MLDKKVCFENFYKRNSGRDSKPTQSFILFDGSKDHRQIETITRLIRRYLTGLGLDLVFPLYFLVNVVTHLTLLCQLTEEN